MLNTEGVFFSDMVSASVDYVLVLSNIYIGHLLGKVLVAEFVLSGATFELLRTLGVDFVQGYAIGRPVAIAAMQSED